MLKYSDPVDLVFYALSHPVRREILNLIRAKEKLVTDLASQFEVSLAAISKHIKILERAKLIKREREGRVHLIHLNHDALLTADEWLKQYRAFWSGQLDQLDQYVESMNKKEAT